MGPIYQIQIPLQDTKKYAFQKILVILDGRLVELWLLVPLISEEASEMLLN